MPTSIFRDEVQRLIREEEAQLFEVLPPAMFEDECIVAAVNIPLKDLDLQTTSSLDKGRRSSCIDGMGSET